MRYLIGFAFIILGIEILLVTYLFFIVPEQSITCAELLPIKQAPVVIP